MPAISRRLALFCYTLCYYGIAEAVLRKPANDRGFEMSGYKASDLSPAQCEILALVLTGLPDEERAVTLISIIEAVMRGDTDVAPVLGKTLSNSVSHDMAWIRRCLSNKDAA